MDNIFGHAHFNCLLARLRHNARYFDVFKMYVHHANDSSIFRRNLVLNICITRIRSSMPSTNIKKKTTKNRNCKMAAIRVHAICDEYQDIIIVFLQNENSCNLFIVCNEVIKSHFMSQST